MMTTHTSAFSILYSVQITLNNRYWDTSDDCQSTITATPRATDCQCGTMQNGRRRATAFRIWFCTRLRVTVVKVSIETKGTDRNRWSGKGPLESLIEPSRNCNCGWVESCPSSGSSGPYRVNLPVACALELVIRYYRKIRCVLSKRLCFAKV
jgi:hypothetical protein